VLLVSVCLAAGQELYTGAGHRIQSRAENSKYTDMGKVVILAIQNIVHLQ
jgi:hypothetical protein